MGVGAQFGELAYAAAKGSGGAHSHEQMTGRLTELVQNLSHGAFRVGVEGGFIGILVEVERIGDLFQKLGHAGAAGGEPIAGFWIGVVEQFHVCAVGPHGSYRGGVDPRIHHAVELHPLERGLASKSHAQVAGGRFHQRRTRANIAGFEGCLDKGSGGPVFCRTAEVELFEFEIEVDIRPGANRLHSHEWGVANRRVRLRMNPGAHHWPHGRPLRPPFPPA